MPPKKFAVNLVDISFARAAPTAWYGANTSQICARSNDWRVQGEDFGIFLSPAGSSKESPKISPRTPLPISEPR
ncbi:MAG: hypothetical protein DMG35_08360 [Acidobacteria bacterium]|nr:MAG: hypothetical protein DMG35_08360 [Acidobacteriota bacterium]